MRRRHACRGLMLMIVIVAIGLVAGLLALLTTTMAQRYRERQAQRVGLIAYELVQSGARYAQAHKSAWSRTPPDKPLDLNVKALLPARFTGSAVLSFAVSEGRKTCHVVADAAWEAYSSHREIDIPLDAP